jgi:hypothetical protein
LPQTLSFSIRCGLDAVKLGSAQAAPADGGDHLGCVETVVRSLVRSHLLSAAEEGQAARGLTSITRLHSTAGLFWVASLALWLLIFNQQGSEKKTHETQRFIRVDEIG